jgi:hypothetical protein
MTSCTAPMISARDAGFFQELVGAEIKRHFSSLGK